MKCWALFVEQGHEDKGLICLDIGRKAVLFFGHSHLRKVGFLFLKLGYSKINIRMV